MERHVVLAAVLQAVAAAKKGCGKKATRATYSDEVIAEVTRSARQLGSGFKAAKEYNKRHAEDQDFAPIPDDTAQCWYKHWKKTGANKTNKKRGRKEIVTPSEKEEINLAFDLLRAPKQGESVSAREYGSITRGIVEKHRPAILIAHGGPAVLDRHYARYWLRKQESRGVRAETTDRLVSDQDLVNASGPFYADLKSKGAGCPRELMINADEFFVTLGRNRKWSLQRRSEGKYVTIRNVKAGFTASAITSAAGEIIKLQLNHKGDSNAVHAAPDEEHPRIFQTHQPVSHFQNAQTFSVLLNHVIEYVNNYRVCNNCPNQFAVFLLDAHGSHWTDGNEQMLAGANIRTVPIPKKMTHIWQPAD